VISDNCYESVHVIRLAKSRIVESLFEQIGKLHMSLLSVYVISWTQSLKDQIMRLFQLYYVYSFTKNYSNLFDR
jgi:hypothetical protein